MSTESRTPLKAVIVGGVAAGMSAAARLRRLNESARIVVLERGDHVSVASCGLPYQIGGFIKDRSQLLLQTPASLRELLELDVRTGHEVLSIDRGGRTVTVLDRAGGTTYTESYDKLVLCPGALPIRPALPGLDHPAILTLRSVADMDAIQKRLDGGARAAVVIGGGYIGLEMAENLRARGLEVDLVELQAQLLPPLDAEMAWPIEEHVRANGVRLHLGTAAGSFHGEGERVAVVLQSGTRLVADLVILAVGVKPDVSMARAAGLAIGPRGGITVDAHLRTSDPNIYAAGDAVETPHAVLGGNWVAPLAGPANRQGRTVADNLSGRPTRWAGALGTAIVRAFDMTAGGTGANEKALQHAGVPYRKLYLHPANHAGYYPGATSLHLKVLFAPETGRLLGAQVVGGEGVDKRIDVLATALAGGLSVVDLQNLELAYAPPYGSAKDPINMAGFIGSNMLVGDLEPWYAEELSTRAADGVIVDVRGKADFDRAHIPGAICIPLGQLRARAGELPVDRPVFLYCKVGFRSYVAMRILKQRGFRVFTLSGGFDTFRAWHRGA